MIEVEQMFLLKEGDKERLISNAVFLGEKKINDVYYDTSDLVLCKKDTWLRLRDGKFELKVPVRINYGEFAQQYNEIETDNEIRKVLKISGNKTLAEDLAASGYGVIAGYITFRKTYKKGDFKLDFDLCNFGDSEYQILEIELMVADPSDANKAMERIKVFAEEHGLPSVVIYGKLFEYLRRLKPGVYKDLVEAGIIENI